MGSVAVRSYRALAWEFDYPKTSGILKSARRQGDRSNGSLGHGLGPRGPCLGSLRAAAIADRDAAENLRKGTFVSAPGTRFD